MVSKNQHMPIERLTLGDMILEWVTNFKYLGLMFNSGRSLHFDSSCVTRKYYGSCNSILGHCKYADECVRLSLVKSFCVPLLTLYWCCRRLWSAGKDLAVCWNDSFRRIFGYKRHESVKVLQFYCGELPFDLLYELIKWGFLTSLSGIPVRFHILYELNRHKVESYILWSYEM